MRSIWKFPLELEMENQTIKMPRDAKIVHVEMQGKNPCIWAIVDEKANTVDRTFMVTGTGWGVGPDVRYVGTCSHGSNHSFVWHVWEV